MPEILLRINDKFYDNVTEVELTRSLECGSGSFTATVSALPPDRQDQPVELILDGETVLSGWLDGDEDDSGPTDFSRSLTGRDKVGDIIDCSPFIGQFDNLGILAIAKRLCKPFGIKVSTPNTPATYGKAFDTIAGEPGETVFSFLDRLARMRGLLLWSDGLGSLVIGLPSWRALPAHLTAGVNATFNVKRDYSRLYSEIRVIAQTPGGDGEDAGATSVVVKEPRVKRYRPLTIIAEQSAEEKDLRARAETEIRMRWADSLRVTASVKGWRVAPGLPIWPLGRMVTVTDPEKDLHGFKLAIAGITFRTHYKEGDSTELELVPRRALDRAIELGKEI